MASTDERAPADVPQDELPGWLLKRALQAGGRSQREVAELVGVSQQAVAGYVRAEVPSGRVAAFREALEPELTYLASPAGATMSFELFRAMRIVSAPGTMPAPYLDPAAQVADALRAATDGQPLAELGRRLDRR